MKTAFCLLFLVCSALQSPAYAQSVNKPPQVPQAAPPDAVLTDLLAQLQATAAKSDSDLARLRIDKWKAESASRQQDQAAVTSIRRNLDYAIPDLLQQIQAQPGSLAVNFRLYRNLTALYETFSSLTESAGAFGTADQYSSLAADISQLDQLRHQFAERMDQLAASRDAEILRLRAQSPATSSKPATKIVVDDNQPPAAAKKKPKPPQPSASPQP
jgi:hypothetical protein